MATTVTPSTASATAGGGAPGGSVGGSGSGSGSAGTPAGTYVLGIVGGSGLYAMEGVTDVSELVVDTPYGPPSDTLMRGTLPGGVPFVFLPRHGRGHRIPPHQINYRANICALKKAGVTHLVSVSAVGSMREDIRPGHLAVPDQFIDLTKRRISTFFEDGIAAHVPFADPVCGDLAGALADAAAETGAVVHRGGTYVSMEGPQFSTRAESNLYRTWGVSVIGMTAMPEAKLAREAEIPFATLALATDYDCWHTAHDDVTVDAVMEVIAANVEASRRTVALLATRLPDPTKSIAHGAASKAIMTAPEAMTEAVKMRLAWLLPHLHRLPYFAH